MPSNENSISIHDLHLCDMKGNEITDWHQKTTVIDFWTLKCPKCPEALQQMNQFAKCSTHVFVACLLLQECQKFEDLPGDLMDAFSHMSHAFMTFENKEHAKKILGFSSVPFYAVFGANGTLIATGSDPTVYTSPTA